MNSDKMIMKKIIFATIFCIFFNAGGFATIYEGYCGDSGDNLTWKHNTETGILTISGTGDMATFVNNPDRPWNSIRDKIFQIVIGDGVTSIGHKAFYDCFNLTKISIGDNVESIGVMAFYNCGKLMNIILPEKVKSIENGAFRGCSSVTNITIGDNVTFIGNEAFRGCRSLKSIVIPQKITSIGDETFQDCNDLASITIPESVTSIGDRAFLFCRNLKIIKALSLTSPRVGKDVFTGNSGRLYILPGASGYDTNGWESRFNSSRTDTIRIVLPVEINGKGKLDNAIDDKYYFVPGETLTLTASKGYELDSVMIDDETIEMTNGQYIPSLTKADSGKTVTANFSKLYLVRFISEDILEKEIFVSKGTTIPTSEIPILTRAGYVFSSWNTNIDGKGETWDFDKEVNNDISLHAQWEFSPNENQARIIIHPASANICLGSEYSLSVHATGPNRQYQWYYNNKPIPNETGSAYIITNAHEGHFGTYTVTVKASEGEIVTSRAAYIRQAHPLPAKPTLASVPRESIQIGNNYQFAATSYDNVILYEWHSKSGTTQFWPKTGQTTRVTFTQTGDEIVYLTLTHSCGNRTIEYPVTVLNSTANEPINEILKAYPNPVSDIINLTGLRPNAIIKIYAQTGVAIATYKAEYDKMAIDLTNLKPGLYFLVTGDQTIKFIKD